MDDDAACMLPFYEHLENELVVQLQYSRTISAAICKLQTVHFDLLITDMLLPMGEMGEENRQVHFPGKFLVEKIRSGVIDFNGPSYQLSQIPIIVLSMLELDELDELDFDFIKKNEPIKFIQKLDLFDRKLVKTVRLMLRDRSGKPF